MRKIIIDKPFNVEIKDVPIPVPKPGEILIKTELSGISSGTEMMLYRGTFPNFTLKKWPQWTDYPVCPGYELVGTVVEVCTDSKEQEYNKQLDSLQPKSAVIKTDASEFKVGDKVLCLGEHSEYACLPSEFVAKIPEGVSSQEATLGALATTAMHAIHRAEIEYGDTVAIIGVGILGYLTMQHAKLAGTRKVIAIDKDDSRLEIAEKCGADLIINPDKECPTEKILEFNGVLADVVIEASGYKGTEQLALDIIRDRGKIIILGWHTDNIDFLFGDLYFKEAKIIATRAGGPEAGLPYAYVRWTSDQTMRYCLDLISEGKLSGKHFKPSIFKADEIKNVYKMIHNRDLRIGMQALLKWD